MGWEDLGIDWQDPEKGIHVYSALKEIAKAINERFAINDAHYQEFPLLALSEAEFTEVEFQRPFFRAVNTPTTTSVGSLLNPFRMITRSIDMLFPKYARTDLTSYDPDIDDTNLNNYGMPDAWGGRSNYESITGDTTLTDIESGSYFTGAGVDSAMLTDLYNLLTEIKFVFLNPTKTTLNSVIVEDITTPSFAVLWTLEAPAVVEVTGESVNPLFIYLRSINIPSVHAPPNGKHSGYALHGEEEYSYVNQSFTAMPPIVTPPNSQVKKYLILPFTGLQFANPQAFTEDSFVFFDTVAAGTYTITKTISDPTKPDPLQFGVGGQRTNFASKYDTAPPCFDIDDTQFLAYATL